jgi:chromosome segregation ATPase
MAKEKVLAKVATLLEKFTERLTRFAEQQSTVEKNIKDLQYQTFTTVERILRVENETRDREARQTLRDQNNVQSLVNLRESTAKAFNQVRDDIASLIKQVQRLNERVGQVESQTSAGVLNIDSLLRRVTKAETGPSSIDQRYCEFEAPRRVQRH